MMDSITTLSYSILSPSEAYPLVQPSQDGRHLENPKAPTFEQKILYSFLSAGGAKLEIAALFKPWTFQAYLGTDSGANYKHRNQSS